VSIRVKPAVFSFSAFQHVSVWLNFCFAGLSPEKHRTFLQDGRFFPPNEPGFELET